MKRYDKTRKRSGMALFATLIFIAVFMAMAVGMMSMSSHNVIASSNLQTVNATRSTAESGLEVVRYWLSQVSASNGNVYADTINDLKIILDDAGIAYVDPIDADGHQTLRIGPVPLDQAQSRSFEAMVKPEDRKSVV